jgi:hypothetical protein
VIDNSLYSYLLAQAPLSNLISDRLYPGILPEEAGYPAVAYIRVSTPRLYGIGGPMGYAEPRIQFSAFARTYAETVNVIAALRTILDGFRGVMGDTNVREISSDNELGEHDGGYEPVSKTYQRRIDFYVAHEE